jgi:tRNA dimethylallyltransferase
MALASGVLRGFDDAAGQLMDVDMKFGTIIDDRGQEVELSQSSWLSLLMRPDVDLRRRLEEEAHQIGTPALHQRLTEVDPKAGQRILVNDLRRIVRALEIYTLTGKPISDWQQEFDNPADPRPKVACLVRPREEIRRRIAERTQAMFAAGWIEEARQLFARTPPPGREARQAVGYEEIAEHLAGTMTFEQLVENVTIRTRQFAKRQMTWFRHLEELQFFETSEHDDPGRLTQGLVEFFSASAGGKS